MFIYLQKKLKNLAMLPVSNFTCFPKTVVYSVGIFALQLQRLKKNCNSKIMFTKKGQ